MSTTRNFKVFFIYSILSLSSIAFAEAGAGLKAVAQAQQKEYHEIKALGSDATPEKIEKIHREIMGPARLVHLNEMAGQQQSFIQKFKRALKGTKEQIAALWGFDPKTGRPPERKPGDAPPPSTKASSIAAPTAQRKSLGGPSPTTGLMEGNGEAKSMGFKSEEEKKAAPNVVDGIIQEQ